MKTLTYTENVYKQKDKWVYKLKFSDNPYTMVYKNEDYLKVLEVKSKMNGRIDNHFNIGSDLITSDIGFKYIEKS